MLVLTPQLKKNRIQAVELKGKLTVSNPSDATLKNIEVTYPGGFINIDLLEAANHILKKLFKCQRFVILLLEYIYKPRLYPFHANTTDTRFDETHNA